MTGEGILNALRLNVAGARRVGLYPGKSRLWETMEQAADLIENQQNHIRALMQANDALRSAWVPVTERLPEFGNLVFVTVSGRPQENVELIGALQLATLYDDGWCVEPWPEWQGAIVTHWMPLPEPPEVER